MRHLLYCVALFAGLLLVEGCCGPCGQMDGCDWFGCGGCGETTTCGTAGPTCP